MKVHDEGKVAEGAECGGAVEGEVGCSEPAGRPQVAHGAADGRTADAEGRLDGSDGVHVAIAARSGRRSPDADPVLPQLNFGKRVGEAPNEPIEPTLDLIGPFRGDLKEAPLVGE
jgi:hypothetical protein